MASVTQSVAQLAASRACVAASSSADSSQQSAAPAMEGAATGFRVAAGSITSAQSAELAAGGRCDVSCRRWVLLSPVNPRANVREASHTRLSMRATCYHAENTIKQTRPTTMLT